MIKFNINEKRIIVAILIAIMEADGIIDPHETDYLDDVMLSLGVTEPELDSIDELDFSLVISDFKKFDASKKEVAYKLFIDMAKCDGYADPRELKIIEQLCN